MASKKTKKKRYNMNDDTTNSEVKNNDVEMDVEETKNIEEIKELQEAISNKKVSDDTASIIEEGIGEPVPEEVIDVEEYSRMIDEVYRHGDDSLLEGLDTVSAYDSKTSEGIPNSANEAGYGSVFTQGSGIGAGYNSGNPQNIGGNVGYSSGNLQNVGVNAGYNSGNPQNVGVNAGYNSGNPQNVGVNAGYNSGNPQNVGGNAGYNAGFSQGNYGNGGYNAGFSQNAGQNVGYNSGYPQNNAGNVGYNAGFSQNPGVNMGYNAGYPQNNAANNNYNAGFSQNGAGNMGYNNAYPQNNGGYPVNNAGNYGYNNAYNQGGGRRNYDDYYNNEPDKSSRTPLIIAITVAAVAVVAAIAIILSNQTRTIVDNNIDTPPVVTSVETDTKDDVSSETEKITENIVTEAPTTEEPTTEAPTTEAPTTEAPTTEEPTTEAPTTEEVTTEAPTEPVTEEPTTEYVPVQVDIVGKSYTYNEAPEKLAAVIADARSIASLADKGSVKSMKANQSTLYYDSDSNVIRIDLEPGSSHGNTTYEEFYFKNNMLIFADYYKDNVEFEDVTRFYYLNGKVIGYSEKAADTVHYYIDGLNPADFAYSSGQPDLYSRAKALNSNMVV